MGRHADAGGRRRVAAWPIVVAVVVLLVAALTVGYFVILDKHDDVAACTGDTVLQVTASPGAARAVTDAATAFNATKPVARSTCVSVSVSTTSGSVAAAALVAGWKNQPTPAPALWVVDSAADVAFVDAGDAAMTAGHTNSSLAISPVVLAVRTAPTGPAVSWSSLAGGSGTAQVMALPDPTTNRASSYALESLVAASITSATGVADPDDKPVDAAAVTGASAVLSRLAASSSAASSSTAQATTAAALTALNSGQATYTAVPVVESELAAFNTANPPGLTAVYPAGPTAHDEIMAVPLTAAWVTDAMSDAAAAFDAYLGDPTGIAILTSDHLRTSATPATAPGVNLRTTVTALPEARSDVRTALLAAWSSATAALATGNSSTPPTIPTTPPDVSGAPDSTAPTSGPSTSPSPGVSGTTAPTSSSTVPVKPTTPTTPTRPTTPTTPTPPSTPKSNPPTTPTTQATPAVTLVLDTSGSTDTVEDGQQRITWMRAAALAAMNKNPLTSYGLWSFSTMDGSSGYRKLVPVGALTDQVGAGTRFSAITTSLTGLFPGGDSWTYRAIQAAYTDAVDGAVAGRPNRVIVMTDGADTTPGLSRAVLKSTIAALAGRNKDVELDIIGLSTDVSSAAMTEIAQAGGGTFTPLASLSDLGPTLEKLTATG